MNLYSIEVFTITLGTDNHLGLKQQYLVLANTKTEAQEILNSLVLITRDQPTDIVEVQQADDIIRFHKLSAENPAILLQSFKLIG